MTFGDNGFCSNSLVVILVILILVFVVTLNGKNFVISKENQ